MTSVFCDLVARFVHVYLDDIFIYSSTIEEHKNHLAQVFDKLREAQLYLSWDKVDLYSERWTVSAILSPTQASTPALIKCKKYGTGDSPVIFMKSRDFLDSCNIWHIICQMLLHTRRP